MGGGRAGEGGQRGRGEVEGVRRQAGKTGGGGGGGGLGGERVKEHSGQWSTRQHSERAAVGARPAGGGQQLCKGVCLS